MKVKNNDLGNVLLIQCDVCQIVGILQMYIYFNFYRLPPMTLVHGDSDKTVPPSSTSKFSQLCCEMSTHINEFHIPQCGHIDVCFDLMDPKRNFYDVVMGLIHQVAQAYL